MMEEGSTVFVIEHSERSRPRWTRAHSTDALRQCINVLDMDGVRSPHCTLLLRKQDCVSYTDCFC